MCEILQVAEKRIKREEFNDMRAYAQFQILDKVVLWGLWVERKEDADIP